MSKQGLELLSDLSEVRNAVAALDNLCTGPAEPFNSSDFKVFAGNKRNVSIFTYIPNSFTTTLSGLSGKNGTYRLEVIKTQDVDKNVVNCNISVGDIVYGEGLQPDSVIERIDVISTISNRFSLPVTEVVLTKSLTANIPPLTPFTLKKQNNASINNNEIILGEDTEFIYYTGDVIKSIYYPLSTSTESILNTDTTRLYVVNGRFNENSQFCFGLSPTLTGDGIDLTSLNALCAINFDRVNEVTGLNFRNIFLPESVDNIGLGTSEGLTDSTRTYYSMLRKAPQVDYLLSEAFDVLDRRLGLTNALLLDKIKCNKDNLTNKNITIDGVVKIADPDNLNNNTISSDPAAPSIYILNPLSGLNDKKRIFSDFDSPWITTSESLSTNRNISVGSLTFDNNIHLDQIQVQPIDPVSVAFNRKIPISIVGTDGIPVTYFLLASSQA